MKIARWVLVIGLGSLALFTACDSATGPEGKGQIQLLITDAPADYIKSAEVCISGAYLQPAEEQEGEEGEGTRVDLTLSETPKCLDLMDLQEGLTAELTNPIAVEVGSYHQLRLVVESAEVELAEVEVEPGVWEQLTFNDGNPTKTLSVPSGMASGIKVDLLDGPITPVEGLLTVVTVDFDVNDNFVIQGNPETPAGIHGILFTPVLKEKQRSEEEL